VSTDRWVWYIEWSTPRDAHLFAVERVVYRGESKYQRIEIMDLAEVGRALILDGKIQSTLSDEKAYHESLVHPPLIAHGAPRRVLILGGGEGATLREVLRYRSLEEAVMVDLDEKVIEACRTYLPEMSMDSFNDPRSKLIISDARKYLEKAEDTYDAIVIDLVDPMEGGAAQLLYTEEFYRLVKKHLNPGGIMVTQATSPSFTLDVFTTIHNTISQVFEKTSAYATFIRSFDGLWGFVTGSDSISPAELSAEEVDSRISSLLEGELEYYDGTTHTGLFSLPKPIRKALEKEERIARDNNPVYMPI